MPEPKHFQHINELKSFCEKHKKGFIVVGYKKLEDYEGMVLCIVIRFNTVKHKYELDLEWQCLGLDFYGDTLHESYVYKFDTLEHLLDYLESKYQVKITDIPKAFKFDHSGFPDPVKDSANKEKYQMTWEKFQDDFKKNIFFDNSLHLVYSSSSK